MQDALRNTAAAAQPLPCAVFAKAPHRCYRTRPLPLAVWQTMKPIARALAACALLLTAVPAPASPLPPRQLPQHGAAQQTALTQRASRELTSAQYQERADNPTLAEQREGHNAVILKRRGTGGCSNGWRDA